MGIDRLSSAMLRHDDIFASKAAAEAVALGKLNTPTVRVIEAGEVVSYVKTPGATGLIGADASTWRKASVSEADLLAVVSDADEILAQITRGFGDWTPALAFAGGGGSFNYGARAGRWRIMDGINYVEASMTVELTTLGTGILRLSGLAAELRPMAGVFPGYLQMPAKNGGFFLPYGAAEVGLSWTPGSSFGVFNYYGSSGQLTQYVTAVTGTIPSGDYSTVTWAGGSGRLEDWRAEAGATGRLVLINVTGVLPTGTITGTGWTATASGVWQGAKSGESFLTDINFAAGMQIAFVLQGSWRTA